MKTNYHTRQGYEPSKHLIPSNSYRLKYDAEILKRDDVVDIFSIERGSNPVLYACYCPDKDVTELVTEDVFR